MGGWVSASTATAASVELIETHFLSAGTVDPAVDALSCLSSNAANDQLVNVKQQHSLPESEWCQIGTWDCGEDTHTVHGALRLCRNVQGMRQSPQAVTDQGVSESKEVGRRL